jgi:ribosomal protein S18 acetylase RimI-like enzyme
MINYNLVTRQKVSEILDMMANFYAIDKYPFNRIKSENNLLTFIDDDSLGLLYLIENNSETMGYICITFGFSFEYGGRIAFVDEFYLKPEFRNQGIGPQVMEFIERKSIELEVKSLLLEVEKHNGNAQRLYAKQGFKSKDRPLLSKRII